MSVEWKKNWEIILLNPLNERCKAINIQIYTIELLFYFLIETLACHFLKLKIFGLNQRYM